MKILVLGGTGVISKYVVDEFLNHRHTVWVFNRGNRIELEHPKALNLKVNVNDKETLVLAVKNEWFDKIIDFTTFTPDVMEMKLSVLGDKCNHYIFISTIATYEPSQTIHEENSPIYNSKWLYGYNKSLCEGVIKDYYSQNAGCFTIIRPGLTWSEMFIPYSPFDSYNMPGYLIHHILYEKEIATLNSGQDKMQIMFAGDFAYNLRELLQMDESKNDIFNLTGDEYISSNAIAESLALKLKKQIKFAYIPEKYVMNTPRYENNIVKGGWHGTFSNEKIKRVIKNYSTKTKWIDKLEIVIEYFYRYQKFIGWTKADEQLWLDIINEVKQDGMCDQLVFGVTKDIETKEMLYKQLFEKNYFLEISLEKEWINNRCLKKWLYLKGKNKNIFDYLLNQGIYEITLYGYGVLGQFALEEAKRSHIHVKYLIDRGNVAIEGTECKNTFSGDESEIVLVAVMTDTEAICRNLAEQNCKRILLLEDVLDDLLVTKKYPELLHYEELENKNVLEIANFGTGMGFYDFIYDDMPINASNFALTQQTLQMDYKLMCHYQNKLANGCKVILTLPYCIFCAEKIKGTEDIYNRYYALLPENEVIDVCSGTYCEYKAKLRYDSFRMVDYKLELKVPLDAEQMQEQSKEAIVNWMEQLGIISFSSGELSLQVRKGIEKNKKWLQNILSFCKERNFEPIIVVPPMSQVLLDKISMEFRESHFYQPLYEVVGEDVQILDYSNDAKFCNPNLYGWPGFLIQDAAKEFTKDVLLKIGAL